MLQQNRRGLGIIAGFVRLARNALTVGARTSQLFRRAPLIGETYTVTEQSKMGSVAVSCATFEEAFEIANRKIVERAPGTRVTLKNNVTGAVYGENGIRSLGRELN